MLCALIQDSICIAIRDLSADELIEESRTHQLVMDITDESPQPQVGWVFTGQRLVHPNPESLLKHVKIFRFMSDQERRLFADYSIPPHGWNYKTGLAQRLDHKDVKTYGRIITREFYGSSQINPDGTVTLTDKVVMEEYSYMYSEYGDVIRRTITIRWVLEDETYHPDAKSHIKTYLANPDEILEEAIAVRKAFSNDLKIVLRQAAVPSIIANDQIPPDVLAGTGGNTVLAAELVAIALLEEYESQFDSFISMGAPGTVTAIMSDQNHVWLDNELQAGVSFRQYIAGQIMNYIQGLGRVE